MKTAVVIPAFNESRQVRAVVMGVKSYVDMVVVVDDGSIDDTAVQALSVGAMVLRHIVNRGQGAALKTGIDYALGQGADVIITFDSDGQHDPADIPLLLQALKSGQYEVALGSRFLSTVSNVPWLRRLVLKVGVLFTKIVSGIKVTDTHNGLRALSAQAAERINITQDKMAHASEILDEIATKNISFTEVPVNIIYTKASIKGSKQGALPALKIVRDFFIGKLLR